MFIKISDDITEILLSPDCHEYSNIVRFMHEVAICMLRSKHFIFIPSLRKQSVRDKIKKIMPEVSDILFQADNSEFRSLEEKMDWKMIVTRSEPPVGASKTLYYNPLRNKEFELYKETHLICENLYDCDFYHAITQSFCNHYRKLRSFIFFPRNGGGATTPSVIKKEMDKGNHLCLVICDSDRHYPDGPVGDTLNNIDNVFKDNKSNYIHLLKLESISEIENLIPHRLLRDDLAKYKPTPKKLSDDLLNTCDTSFFDFKKGLVYEDLFHDKSYEHWKPILDKLGINTDKRNSYLKKAHHDKEKYESLCESEPKLISGWGGSILSNTLNEKRKELEKFNLDHLSGTQRFYWDAIGNLIFNWCICRRIV